MIKYIEQKEALDWLSKQDVKGTWHENFNEWKQHLLVSYLLRSNEKDYKWSFKKFYRGNGKWLGAFVDNKLSGIYWYTIVKREMYDGFLIADPKTPKIGLKLGIELFNLTKNDWDINYSMCSEKYLKFNERLGFKVWAWTSIKDKVKKHIPNDIFDKTRKQLGEKEYEVYLLKRLPK